MAVHILLQAAFFVLCVNGPRAKVDQMPKRGKKKERKLILPIGAFTSHSYKLLPVHSPCSLQINQVLILLGHLYFPVSSFCLPCEWPNGNNSRAIHTSKLLWGSGTRLLPLCESIVIFPSTGSHRKSLGTSPAYEARWHNTGCKSHAHFLFFLSFFFLPNLLKANNTLQDLMKSHLSVSTECGQCTYRMSSTCKCPVLLNSERYRGLN